MKSLNHKMGVWIVPILSSQWILVTFETLNRTTFKKRYENHHRTIENKFIDVWEEIWEFENPGANTKIEMMMINSRIVFWKNSQKAYELNVFQVNQYIHKTTQSNTASLSSLLSSANDINLGWDQIHRSRAYKQFKFEAHCDDNRLYQPFTSLKII